MARAKIASSKKIGPKFEVGVSTSTEAVANFPKWNLQQLIGITALGPILTLTVSMISSRC